MRGLGPFRSRDFALYWAGLSVSAIGEWVEHTTTAWLLYEITSSPILLGLNGGIRAVTAIVFGLVGGAVADRVPRRQLLFVTQSGFAVSSLVLGALLATGQLAVWHIYVFASVNGSLAAFDAPARRSLFPTLVPRGEMQNAVTLNSSIFRIAKLIGPLIAGVIVATYGPAVAYFVNFLSYAAILVALAVMRAPHAPERVGASLRQDIVAGTRYTLAHPLLRTLLGLESVHNLFGANTALLTILARDVFRTGPEGLGVLLSAQAVGGLIATAGLVTIGDIERKGRAMIAAGGAYVLALAVLPFAPELRSAAVVVATIGLTDGLWTTMRNTVFHLTTEERYRGRTMGLLLLAGRGASQGSQLQTGIVVSLAGPVLAPLAGAAVIAASLLAVNARTADVRGLRGLPEPALAAAAEHDAG